MIRLVITKSLVIIKSHQQSKLYRTRQIEFYKRIYVINKLCPLALFRPGFFLLPVPGGAGLEVPLYNFKTRSWYSHQNYTE